MRRRAVVAAVALVLVVLGGLLAGQLPGRSPAGGTTRTGPLQLGVNSLALWEDWEVLPALLDRVRDAGTRWVRADLAWCAWEPEGPGLVATSYRERVDELVRLVADRHLQLLLVTVCTPGWAGGGPDGRALPADPAEFGRVVGVLAARYAGRVSAWEVWNEPDCIGGCGKGSAVGYVPLLQAGYRAVKAADPRATVVSGGISGNNARWVDDLYAAGAAGWFDALGVHPYVKPSGLAPDAPSGHRVYRLTTISDVRGVMVRHGDGDRPVWFTEFGWSTARSGPIAGVGEARQARRLTETVRLVAARWPFVTHAFWYSARDRDDSTPLENSFGLLRTDLTPKPAYRAFRSAATDPGLVGAPG
ncbi:cellulase family glycosylhydrolase [Modestobacter sp. NPDC049651]|uniref:cellulase family glycosylhydrolase n=1 Tax=unclassified Modestobacter TaxID=2643866 RepID=UPI0033DCEE03